MPKRSGVSHTFAALATMVLWSYLERYLNHHVNLSQIDGFVESAAMAISSHQEIPFQMNVTATVLTGLTVALLTFAWGYAFHVRVITGND